MMLSTLKIDGVRKQIDYIVKLLNLSQKKQTKKKNCKECVKS